MSKMHYWFMLFLPMITVITAQTDVISIENTTDVVQQRPLLKGVTLRSEPFVRRSTDGNYSGSAVNLIDFIANEVGFDYELYESPDSRYGVPIEGNKWNGMIGQVLSQKADFALGGLVINEPRSEVVDFTTSFHETQLAALVHLNYSTNLTTFRDLAESPNITSVGVLNGGATQLFRFTSQQNTVIQLWAKIQNNSQANLVSSIRDGLTRVAQGEIPFAFISESTYLKYYAETHPEVKVLIDKEKLYPRTYGIALPKNSTYLEGFNQAIQKWRNQVKTL